LAAAVPEVEGEVAEELDVGEIDVDGGPSAVSLSVILVQRKEEKKE
jgi:hypothetical protein